MSGCREIPTYSNWLGFRVSIVLQRFAEDVLDRWSFAITLIAKLLEMFVHSVRWRIRYECFDSETQEDSETSAILFGLDRLLHLLPLSLAKTGPNISWAVLMMATIRYFGQVRL